MATEEYIRSLFDYEPETGIVRRKVGRRGHAAGEVAGWTRQDGYRIIRIKKQDFLAHRIAWLIMTGRWPPDQIDHKNHDPSDNRWDNLRQATSAENNQNSRKKRPTTIYKGVYRTPSSRWYSMIYVNNTQTYLGAYSTPEEAARAYKEASIKYFGQYAHYDDPDQ